MSINLRSHIVYIVIRLLAVVGILLIVEKAVTNSVFLNRPTANPPDYGLEAEAYRDGQAIKSLHHVAAAPRKSKAIVAASITGDNTSWIEEFFPDWERNIYVTNDPEAQTTVTKNKGNEASAYLTYIITHYHNLPEYIVFIHARRYQWHNDDPMYDHVPLLQHLSLAHVAKVGYTSLRCTWTPGCPVGLRPDIKVFDGIFGIQSEYAKTFALLFPERDLPDEIGSPCCAQFGVSRKKVRERPVRDYERVRQWIWDTDLAAGRSGRVLEYLWHILFGQEAVACPDAGECFCKTYGLCNVTCDSRQDCRNRYWPPRWDQALPEMWPKEGQGENGWPVDGWWKVND